MKKRSSKCHKQTLAVLSLFFLASSAEAALYCVMDFGGKRCQFTTLEACQQAAGEQGSCFLNREEMPVPTGGAAFCLAENWRTECIYRDLASCNVVALPRHAACIVNPNLVVTPAAAPVGGTEKGQEDPNYLPSPAYQPNPGQR